MAKKSSGKGKNSAPKVEFSDAPAPKRRGRMAPALVDRDDDIAAALKSAREEAQRRAAEGASEDAPNWVPAEDKGTGGLVAGVPSSTVTEAPRLNISPSDLAMKYGASNRGLLMNARAGEAPKKEKVETPSAPRVITKSSAGQVIRRVQTPREQLPAVDVESVKTKYKEYFPERGISTYPGHKDGLPVNNSGEFNLNSALNAIKEKDVFDEREKELLEESKKKPKGPSTGEYARSADSTDFIDTSPTAASVTTAEARRLAQRENLLKMTGASSHVPEVDRSTGAVKLTPIKLLNGEYVRHEAEAKIFAPGENNISSESYEQAAGGTHVVVNIGGEEYLRPAHIKKTTTYKRTNNNGVFDVMSQTKTEDGLYFKHPDTGQMVKASSSVRTTTPDEYYAQQDRQKELEKERANKAFETQAIQDNAQHGKMLASHPTYSRFAAAIDKHHEALYSQYHGVGETELYTTPDFDGKPMQERIRTKNDEEAMQNNKARAQFTPNTSKLWVAQHLGHFLRTLGDSEVGRQWADAIDRNPDHILKFFRANTGLIGSAGFERTASTAYKEGIKKGIVPKRIVPSEVPPQPGVQYRVPGPFEAQRAREMAGNPPVAESRKNALNLGATEGK